MTALAQKILSPEASNSITLTLSLAHGHQLARAINIGKYEGPADLARKLGLLPPRVTQLLDLTLLAPEIQEEILFLESVDGIEPISERTVRRAFAGKLDFAEQRKVWAPTSSP